MGVGKNVKLKIVTKLSTFLIFTNLVIFLVPNYIKLMIRKFSKTDRKKLLKYSEELNSFKKMFAILEKEKDNHSVENFNKIVITTYNDTSCLSLFIGGSDAKLE